ncbi:MAG: beta-ketoacyl-[acyl-carrier-protein] synthase family protein [Desulfovibrio sp.]|jgi:3-oxoacyl-[acyl-carrier-protein] synthase-1|nr:beta-ketoacyl-[acyl-carrier-protein] synthase family protein [Desulfovibrio sp.]
MNHRVAVTGFGIISSLGASVDTVAKALYEGRSGITVDAERLDRGFICPLTGRIQDFAPRHPLSKKQRKTMPDFAEWAAEAVFHALEEAGLAPEDLRNERTGIIFGCDSSCIAALEQVEKLARTGSTTGIGSGQVFRTMTSCVSMNLNVIFGTQGACWSISGACASGGHAVGQAADLIRLGRQDRVICGGAQEINWQSMCSFDGLRAFSSRFDEPETASRPFDAGRDGLVPSGGAAALMLERYDLAKKRGAKIHAELLGYGFSSDGDSISIPNSAGIGRAMRESMSQAGLSRSDITYVCAHATSTPVGDAMEATNLLDIFGDRGVPVSSTKSMTGHELWMSGAAQVVYTGLMARHGFIAANKNFEQGDALSSRLDIVRKTLETPPGVALCNSAGFGGTNSCLALDFTPR